jgi:hypothetical protein
MAHDTQMGCEPSWNDRLQTATDWMKDIYCRRGLTMTNVASLTYMLCSLAGAVASYRQGSISAQQRSRHFGRVVRSERPNAYPLHTAVGIARRFAKARERRFLTTTSARDYD